MWVERIYTPGLAVNTYLIGHTASQEALVIDPTRDIGPILSLATEKRVAIRGILETHVHADFLSGSKELKESLNGKPLIFCSAMGGPQWLPAYADTLVYDGDSITLGDGGLIALHTPGHTPEHICWLAVEDMGAEKRPWALFSGDTLFVGSIGRPDLFGEKFLEALLEASYHSLFERLAFLPDFLEILPAHGAGSACGKGIQSRNSSTIGYERLYNPFFIKKPFNEWQTELLRDMPSIPPYYAYLKRRNVEGAALLKSVPPCAQLDSDKIQSDEQLLDIRMPLEFAQAHLPRAINIPLSPNFINWVGLFIKIDQPIVLIGSSEEQVQQALQRLHLIGFDQVDGFILAQNIPKEVFKRKITILDVSEVSTRLKDPESLEIIDVRTDEEWQSGHISTAKHIPLSQLEKYLDKISREKPIALICASGARSSTAASLLYNRYGFQDVSNIKGGMQAWREAVLPIVNQV